MTGLDMQMFGGGGGGGMTQMNMGGPGAAGPGAGGPMGDASKPSEDEDLAEM